MKKKMKRSNLVGSCLLQVTAFAQLNCRLVKLLKLIKCDLNHYILVELEKTLSKKNEFLAPLAVGQRAYVMARCPSCVCACVRPCVNFFFKHLLR